MLSNKYSKFNRASPEGRHDTSHEQPVATPGVHSSSASEATQAARRKRLRVSVGAIPMGGNHASGDSGSSSSDESNDFTSSADEFDESDESSDVEESSSGLAGYTVLATCPVVSHAQREVSGLRVAFSTTTCDTCAVLFGNNRPGSYVEEDHASLWGSKPLLPPSVATPCLQYNRSPQPATARVGDNFAVSVSIKSTAGATDDLHLGLSISHFILYTLKSVQFEDAQNSKLMVHSRREAHCSKEGGAQFELQFETAGKYLIVAYPIALNEVSRALDLSNTQGCSCLITVAEKESNSNVVEKLVKQSEAPHRSQVRTADDGKKESNGNDRNGALEDREPEIDDMVDDNEHTYDSSGGSDVECHSDEREDQTPLHERAVDLSQILETSADTMDVVVELLLGALPKVHMIADRVVLCAASLSRKTPGGRGRNTGLAQKPSDGRSQINQKNQLTLDFLRTDLGSGNPVILALVKMLDLRAMLVSTEVATSGMATSRSGSSTDPSSLRFAVAVAHASRCTARVLRDAWLECATAMDKARLPSSPAASPAAAIVAGLDMHCDYCACCGLPHNTTPTPAAQDDDSQDNAEAPPVSGFELYICDTPGCAAAFHGLCAEKCSMALETVFGICKAAVQTGEGEPEPKVETPPQPLQESVPRDFLPEPPDSKPKAPERSEKPKQTKLVKELIRDLFWRFKEDSEKRTALMTMLEDLKTARLRGELANIPQEVLARAGHIVGEAALRASMVGVKARYDGENVSGSNVDSDSASGHDNRSIGSVTYNSGASSSSSESSTSCNRSSSSTIEQASKSKADSSKKSTSSSSDSTSSSSSSSGGHKRKGELRSASHFKAQEYLLPWTRPDTQGDDDADEETGWSCPFCHAAWALRAAVARGDTAAAAKLMATGLASPFDTGALVACPGGTLNSEGSESGIAGQPSIGVAQSESRLLRDPHEHSSADEMENSNGTSSRNSSNNASTSGTQPLSGFIEWPGAESALHAAAALNGTQLLSLLLPPLLTEQLQEDAPTDHTSRSSGESTLTSHSPYVGISQMVPGSVRRQESFNASINHLAATSSPYPPATTTKAPATPLKGEACADTAPPPPPVFALQDVVMVAARTGPGRNKPGGVARITSYSRPQGIDHDNASAYTYSVQYVLGGRELHVPAHLLAPHDSLQSPLLTSPGGRRVVKDSSSSSNGGGSSSSSSTWVASNSIINRGSRSGGKRRDALFGTLSARSLPLKLPSWCLPKDARGSTPLDCATQGWNQRQASTTTTFNQQRLQEPEAIIFLRGRFADVHEIKFKNKHGSSFEHRVENNSIGNSLVDGCFADEEDLAGGRESFPVHWTRESSYESSTSGGNGGGGGNSCGPKRFSYVCAPIEGCGVGADWSTIPQIASARSRHPTGATVGVSKCGCACGSSKDVIQGSRSSSSSSSSSSSAVDTTTRVHCECGPFCPCERVALPRSQAGGWTRIPRGWCPHRRAQQGLAVRVKVVQRTSGAWELRAAQTIPPRSFVGCFAGEIITWKEASERLTNSRAQANALVPVVHPSLAAEFAGGSDQCHKLGELRPNVVDASTHRNVLAFAAHRCARSATLEMHLHLPGHRNLTHGWPSLWTGSKGLEIGDALTFTRIWPGGNPAVKSKKAPANPAVGPFPASEPLFTCPCELCHPK